MSVYKKLQQEFKTGDRSWHQVSEEEYDRMLNVLPPIRHHSVGFINSEPYSHCAEGAVYYVFMKKPGAGYLVTLGTVKEWDEKTLNPAMQPGPLQLLG